MALKNSKNYQGEIMRNAGIFKVDQIELVPRATAPTDDDLAEGRFYADTDNNLYYCYDGSNWVDLTAAAGAVKIYECTGQGNVTETQVYSALSVDTTDTEIDLSNGTCPGEGNDLVIAVDGTVIDADANFLQAQYKRE